MKVMYDKGNCDNANLDEENIAGVAFKMNLLDQIRNDLIEFEVVFLSSSSFDFCTCSFWLGRRF